MWARVTTDFRVLDELGMSESKPVALKWVTTQASRLKPSRQQVLQWRYNTFGVAQHANKEAEMTSFSNRPAGRGAAVGWEWDAYHVTALAADLAHLFYFWPGRELGFVAKVVWPAPGLVYEDLKQLLIDEAGGKCYGGYEGCLGELHNDGRTHIDHIFPREHGGRNGVNLRAICRVCNTKKGDSIQFIVLGDFAAYAGCYVIIAVPRFVRRHPYATVAVVGGAAFVGGAYFAARWLREREDEDGEMRYQRIGRAVKDGARTRAVRVRDGATNMARGFKDRVGSVRVPARVSVW